MRVLLACCLVFLSLAGAVRAQTPERVAVRILERRELSEVVVLAPQPVRLQARGRRLLVEGRSKPDVSLGGEGFGLRLDGAVRRYPGRLVARAEGSRLVLVNDVPLEAYVAGVVGAELAGDWPVEALKAQAVLARTLAVRGGDHPGRGLCDLTHCQAYAGLASSACSGAAAATRGQILMAGGVPAQPLYHSTCGGTRASNQVAFGGLAVSYLQEGPDPYCAASPHAATWSVRVQAREVARALSRERVTAIEVSDRSPGGWVGAVTVDGERMSGYRFWQALGRGIGWAALKSLNFGVRQAGEVFVFTGHGLGHGVGLCQWGAKGRAERHWDFRRILGAYYPGAVVRKG